MLFLIYCMSPWIKASAKCPKGIRRTWMKIFKLTLFILQICLFLRGASVSWVDGQSVPYAVKGGEWVGFDNRDSYDAKVSLTRLILMGNTSVHGST